MCTTTSLPHQCCIPFCMVGTHKISTGQQGWWWEWVLPAMQNWPSAAWRSMQLNCSATELMTDSHKNMLLCCLKFVAMPEAMWTSCCHGQTNDYCSPHENSYTTSQTALRHHHLQIIINTARMYYNFSYTNRLSGLSNCRYIMQKGQKTIPQK